MLYSSLCRTLLAGGSLLSSAVALPNPAANLSPSTFLRILPLGDSITYGFEEAPGNSYRKFLQCSLKTSGVPVQYVGSHSNGDWDNAENDGYVSQEITKIGESAAWILEQKPPPNVVLLHAGTNDILHSVDVANAPKRLGELIDKVISATGASVLIAQIISLGGEYTQYNAALKTYNDALPAIVDARVAQGKNVGIVDLSNIVPASDLVDGIHPRAAGYRKMAPVWLAGLEGLKINNVTGSFEDLGATAVPSSGNCADLTA
ncbi:lipolytic enzyme [Diplocarpon rosae]|nr:lipolytic enzyme [Diplocarpon rosae]